MRAYVTSIGEPTTKLCVELLSERFEVILLENKTTLWEKLKYIYEHETEDFVRVDADVVPNKNLTADFVAALARDEMWWLQFLTFDWFKQDVTHGGVQFIKAEAIPHLSKHIDEAMNKERPESYMYRLAVFHEPRRCESHSVVMGLQNYKNDLARIKATKVRRNQLELYDFELAERLNQL